MRKTGAQLAVHALEQLGIKYTFGIPGTHTTELYDALDLSDKISPILVNHEGSASFMADAISRTSDSIGTIVIVPAAGLTHAMSGIGEAFLDGIPMMVIAGGTRTDSGREYQLHQFDQISLAKSITKAQYSIKNHNDIISTFYEAYNVAISGEPGPVFIELPVNLQLFKGEVDGMPVFKRKEEKRNLETDKIKQAVRLLKQAKNPMFFVGWGAVDASNITVEIAELLVAPVATTLQGKSAFPNTHPLYTSVGVGESSKPSGQWALKKHDMMLAVGTRFAEISTGSYGLEPPKNLVHIDINPQVFDKNFKTKIAIEGDSIEVLSAILKELKSEEIIHNRSMDVISSKIKEENDKYFSGWLTDKKSDIVSPGHFFKSLKKQLDSDVQLVIDDGKHTFLASELFPIDLPRHFISPTDFNCMGYCVPASIATKLANPKKQVAAIIGDGAFMMTGLEMTTAVNYNLPVMFFIFNDGELGQISQFQKPPFNKKTCSVLSEINFEGIAKGTGVSFVKISNDNEVDKQIEKAIQISNDGKPVLVEVKIDYSKKTMMTKGVIKANLKRFPLREKIRFIARSLKRHIIPIG